MPAYLRLLGRCERCAKCATYALHDNWGTVVGNYCDEHAGPALRELRARIDRDQVR